MVEYHPLSRSCGLIRDVFSLVVVGLCVGAIGVGACPAQDAKLGETDVRPPVISPLPGTLVTPGTRAKYALPELKSAVVSLQIDTQGKRLAHYRRDEIWVWDLEKRAVIARLPNRAEGNGRNFAFLPGGDQLAVCRENGRVVVFDVETQRISQEWNKDGVVQGRPPAHTLMISPSGDFFGVTGRACVFWKKDDREFKTIPTERPLFEDFWRFGKFVPGEKEFVIVGPSGFQFFSVTPLRLVDILADDNKNVPDIHRLFAWSGNSRYFVTARGGTVTTWDRKAGKHVSQTSVGRGTVSGIAFLDRGRKLIATYIDSGLEGRIFVWDAISGRLERNCIMVDGYAAGMVISPDEKQMYVGTERGINVYDVDTLPLVRESNY